MVRGLRQTVFQRSILSRPMKVATPTPCCFKYSTHCWAVLIVSTTMWSSAAQAVDTATSYFSSIAPRSPYHATHIPSYQHLTKQHSQSVYFYQHLINTSVHIWQCYKCEIGVIFFTAQSSYASVVLGIGPSVTRALCDKTKEHTADILIPY